MISRRQFHARSLSLLGTAALPWAAQAATRPPGPGGFPTQTIKVIVPYPAGGIVDVVTRAVVDPLSAVFGDHAELAIRPFRPASPVVASAIRSRKRPVSRLAEALLEEVRLAAAGTADRLGAAISQANAASG